VLKPTGCFGEGKNEESLAPAGNQTMDHPAHSSTTIPTLICTISQIQQTGEDAMHSSFSIYAPYGTLSSSNITVQ
jgi:hypothetical protein